jgi:hypothetical protein
MGLLLTKNTTPILIKGTEIELTSVYVRISFVCNYDGSISVNFKTYLSYNAYLSQNEIYTNIQELTYNFALEPNETQSLETALLYMQLKFLELGYFAEIV